MEKSSQSNTPLPANLGNRDGNRWLTARRSFKLAPAVEILA
jgi:hypothetical protein